MNRFSWKNILFRIKILLPVLVLIITGISGIQKVTAAGICYESPTNPVVTANQTWTINTAAQTVTIRTTFSKTFVDNTYGANAIGWPSGHTFNNLVGSDHVQLALFDAAGTRKMEFRLDYISATNTVTSGYATLGVSGGEGRMELGSSADIVNVKTSLSENFNTFGYVLTTNSPATDASYTPNPTYPNWIFDVWYEVTVKLSAFGAAGFGKPLITDVHASPSKTGNNTEIVDSIPCPGPLSLGNLVWADDNRNGLKDATEFGACTMPVYLYADANNDNIPDGAAIAATNTNLNGNYQFAGLFGGNYIVGVDLHPNDSISPVNGGDPDNNIDNDNNALRIQSGIAYSNAITLTENGEPGGNTNYTLDFGLVSGGADTNRLCFVSPTDPTVYADINWILDWSADCPDQTVTVRVTFSKYFVDNTYGTNAIGWPGGHTFNQLVGSDHVQFALYDANNTKAMEFKVDYITADGSFPSGYGTLGVTGGEGQMLVGNVADVIGTKTSISENFNNYGYVLTTNSPATDTAYTPNPAYPNWIYEVWYEVKVKMSAFGPAGFGRPDITHIHASPSKTGNNTEDLIPGPCCETDPGEISGNETNCGSYDASLITSVQDATGECSNIGTVDCCADGVKIKSLRVKYTGQDCSASNNDQPADKWDCTGNPASDPSVYIIANSNSNPAGGDTWFSGNVALNGEYVIDAANDGKNELASTTYIHIYSQQGGTLLQTIELHTSCSQPLSAGDQFGSAYIVTINKKDGSICSVPNTSLTYKWETSVSPFNAWMMIPNATSATFDPPVITQTTKYRRLSTTCCGTDTSNAVTKTVTNKPDISATALPAIVCAGGTTTLSISPASGLTVIGWFQNTSSGGCNPIGQNLGTASTLTVSPLTTTTYSVVAESAQGCRDTACITVTVNTKPELAVTGGPACASNQQTYAIVFSISSGTAPYFATATAGQATVTGNTLTVTNIPAGSGTTVSVIDNKGCTASYTQAPFQCGCPVNAVIAGSDPDNTICPGESLQLTGSGSGGLLPYVYEWTPNIGNGPGPHTISPNTTTTYRLVIRDDNNNGCSDTAQITITVQPKPNIMASSPAEICQGNTATLSFTPTASVNVIGWFAGCPPAGSPIGTGTTINVTPNNTTSYSVVVASAQGCRDTACTTVTVNPATVLALTGTPQCATNQLTYSIVLTASAGTPPFTATATAGTAIVNGNTITVSNIPSGSGTTVTVTDEEGCPATYTQTPFTCNCPVDAVILTSDADNIICPGESVQISVSPSGGTLPYTYTWTPDIGAGAGPFTVTPTSTTTYQVVVRDDNGNGCSKTAQVTIQVNPKPNININALPAAVCSGNSSTLSFTPTAGLTVSGWFSGCAPIGNSIGSGSTLTVTPATTSSYSVVVSNAQGCRDTACTSVTVYPIPVLSLTAGRVCSPTQVTYSINLTISGGTGPFTATATTGNPIINGNTLTIAGIPSGMGTTVTVTDANGCTSAPFVQAPFSCECTLIASISTNDDDNSICEGTSVTLLGNTNGGIPGFSYQWIPNIGSGPGPFTVTPTTTTTYTFIATDRNGAGCSDTSRVTITVHPKPDVNVFAPPVCPGNSSTLSIFTNSPGVSMVGWFNGCPPSGASIGTNSTLTVTPLVTSTYSAVISSSFGCRDTACGTVIVKTQPPVSITASGPLTFCEGDSVVLTAHGAVSYIWSNGATTQSITVYTPGYYFVTGTGANGCSFSCNAVQVIVKSKPVVQITGPTNTCIGGSVTLTATGAVSYLWSTGATTASIVVTTPGTYSVIGRNADNCSDTAFVNVTLNVGPSVNINASGPVDLCPGGSVTLTATGAVSYVWNTGTTTANITVSAPGIYTVTGTDANGCTDTASVTIGLNTPPACSISGDTSFCGGGATLLCATQGTSYMWNTGANTQCITVTATGDYSVTVTDAAGCTTTCSKHVTVHPNPIVVIVPNGPLNFCEGDSVILTATRISGVRYLWTTGDTTQSITVYTSGIYNVMVTDSFGCTDICVPHVVTVYPNPVVTITGPAATCIGGSVTLTANGALTYLWSTGATTSSITVTVPGSYFVIGTDSNGCSGMDTADVNFYTQPTVNITGPTSTCSGGSVTLTATGAVSYFWSTGETTATISVSASGIYSVIGTDANGCSDTASININILPQPVVNITGPTSTCTGGSVTLTATGGVSYLWSTGATTASITVSAAGTYSVIGTDANGCADSASVNVVINDTPVCSISGDTSSCAGTPVLLCASPGASYLWNTGETTQCIVVDSTGNYSVVVTYASGCTSSCSKNVTIRPNPIVVIVPDGPLSFCEGDSVILTATRATGVSYLWTTGDTTQSIVVYTSGIYNVMVTDSFGCTDICIPHIVTVYPNPVVTITGPAATCIGGSVTLTANGALTYLWSTGATTSSITVTVPGSYFVIGTDSNGCSGMDTADVNFYTQPTVNITGPTSTCTGGSVTLTATGAVSYFWSTGATTVSITVSAAGTYSVIGTDANGCADSASVNVVINDTPVCSISGDSSSCAGTPVLLCASPGASYLWNTGETTQCIVVDSTGNYSVVVTYASGCTSSCSKYVTIRPNPIVVIIPNGPIEFCEGDSVVLTATGVSGVSYLWTTGDTTQSIVVYTSGIYNVMVTDSFGCTDICIPHVVTVYPNPVVTITGPAATCIGGSVTLTANGALTYLWSNGATTQSITVSAAGSYSVIGTDSNGCSGMDTADVNFYTQPTVNITGPTSTCTGGSVTLTATGAVSYLWNTGATTASITVSSSGTYSVIGTDANGCSDSASVDVVINDAPVCSISGDSSSCAGTPVLLCASPGASYLWNTGETTQCIVVDSTATYSVVVTYTSGCTSSCSKNVTIHPNPIVVIVPNGPIEFCEGDSVILTATGVSGVSYLWTTGDTTQSIVVYTSGIYNVMVTDSFGCTDICIPHVVTVYPNPVVTITGPAATCIGGSVTLTANGALTYLWSTGATTSSITVTVPGSYFVIGTDSNGCSGMDTADVNFYTQPTVNITGPTSTCSGGSVTLTASGAVSYLWNTGATTASITVSTSGTYSVIGIDANGCADTASININILPQPVVNITGPTSTCTGGSVTLTATGAVSYLWNTGATTATITVSAAGTYSVIGTDANDCADSASVDAVINDAPVCSISGDSSSCAGTPVLLCASPGASYLWNTGETTQCIVVDSTGNYSVVVTYASGCTSSCSKYVTIRPNPIVVIIPNGPIEFCEGDSVVLTATGVSGVSYLWTTGDTTQSIVVYTSGIYNVMVTDSFGCTDICIPHVVTVHPNPVVTITGPAATCIGGSVTLTANGALTYLWSTGATTSSITVTVPGSYFVIGTDSNGCSGMDTADVNFYTQPTVNITGPTSTCTGGSVTLTATGAVSYLWNTGATNASITVSTAGTYSVIGTDTNGCSDTASININILPQPVVNITGPTSTCTGGSVTLTATGAVSFLWNTGATTASITVSSSGTYSVIGTDANGCSDTASISINLLPQPVVNITGPTSTCSGGSVTLTATGAVSYIWNTGATTASITVSAAGTYSVIGTDANGCADSDSINITITAPPVVNITGPTSTCTGGSVTLTATGAVSYLWSTGATTASITVSAAGTYSVIGTDANGCRDTATINITITAPPVVNISASGPLNFCQGGSVTLTATGATSYLWSTGATTPSITVSASGTYSVTGSNAAQCTDTAAVTVTANRPDVIITGTPLICRSLIITEPATLTASGALTYRWNTGATTASITVYNVGTYTVVGTDALGCKDTTSIVVKEGDKPFVGISADGPLKFCQGDSVKLSANGTGAVAYLWSTGATTSSITVKTSGKYKLTAIASSGCTRVDSVIITVYPYPVVGITGSLNICTGGSTTLTATGATAYIWNTGATTTSITINTPGNYSVIGTTNATCRDTAAVTVTSAPCAQLQACTYTQEFYGDAAGRSCNGVMTPSIMGTALRQGTITIGSGTRVMTIQPADIPAIISKLPASGTPMLLPTGSVSGTGASGSAYLSNGKFNNELLGQTIALSVNLRNNPALAAVYLNGDRFITDESNACENGISAGNSEHYFLPEAVLKTLGGTNTVADLLNLANQALGNTLPSNAAVTHREITEALEAINEGFAACRVLLGFYTGTLSGEGLVTNAYPNPFSANTTIEFKNSSYEGPTTVDVYSVTGQLIGRVFDADIVKGNTYKVEFNAEMLAEGIYVYTITSGKEHLSRKLMVEKR